MSNETLLKKLAIEGGDKVRDDFLVFMSPIIEQEAIDSVVESLKSGWVGTGPKNKQFASDISDFLNIKHVQLVNSCTAALHLAMISLGIGPGDEVIVPTMTFCATVNSVLFTGATPVLVDCDLNSLNVTRELIEKKITDKTKAIIVVHMAGLPVDLDPIKDLAKEKGLPLIEDAAHAFESKYKNQFTGTIGDIGCYSFYATKNLTTAEGGAFVTNNEDLFKIAAQASLHGMSVDAYKRFSQSGFKHYDVSMLGYKYNLTDIQSALGIAHLKKINDYLKVREEIWHSYNEGFKDLPVIVPQEIPESFAEGSLHARHLYVLRLDLDKLTQDRDYILNAIQAEGIGCGIHYKPVHEHSFYVETLGHKASDFPNASQIGKELISLPLSPKMTMKDAEDVIAAVRKVLLALAK
jgi:dTDP-4-amino-4,6-dideoxygalactose transaminase